MNIDINKAKEWIDILHPYMRWTMFIGYCGLFLYINRMFVKDPNLRKWLMASFEEKDGRASGKSLSGFVFSQLIAFATLVAIVYTPDHLLPEYYLISLLTYIASLYGIKMVTKSKYFNGTNDGDSSSQTTASKTNTTTTTTPENTTTTTVINVVEESEEKKDKPKDEGDIG